MPVTSKQLFQYIRGTFRSILFTINSFTLLLLLSSYLSWYVSPAEVVFFAYLGLAFPVVLVVNFMFLIFWSTMHKWRIVGLNIVVFMLCYATISAYFPITIFPQAVPESSIKVLSYNVRGFNWKLDKKWNDTMPMIKYLKSLDADIVCLQEYAVSVNENQATTRNLQKILKDYPYYSVTPLRPNNGRNVYGLACFSKYPIKSTQNIPFGDTDNGAVVYEIVVNGKIVTVINNHLESNRLTTKDKRLYKDFLRSRKSGKKLDEVTQNIDSKLSTAFRIRVPQVDMVARYSKLQMADALIVCGDFNDSPISYSYKTIKNGLVDAYAETGFGPGITYHENKFWFRIDFIMHSKNMKSYQCTVDTVTYSDHYPIWSYLSFK